MRVKYELKRIFENGKLYNIKLCNFEYVNLYVCQQFECYNPSNRKVITIEKASIIHLNTNIMYNQDILVNIKKGLYSLLNSYNHTPSYDGYLVSEDQLNAYTIPFYCKMYSERYSGTCCINKIDCIKIKKKNNPFFVYKSPKLDGEIKKAHYLYIDTMLRKMFYNCGDIILNSNMNIILNNVKQFDELFLETKNMELLMEFKQYLETFYKKMVKAEPEHQKIKNAKDYFELDESPLNQITYLEDLKIKKALLEMN